MAKRSQASTRSTGKKLAQRFAKKEHHRAATVRGTVERQGGVWWLVTSRERRFVIPAQARKHAQHGDVVLAQLKGKSAIVVRIEQHAYIDVVATVALDARGRLVARNVDKRMKTEPPITEGAEALPASAWDSHAEQLLVRVHLSYTRDNWMEARITEVIGPLSDHPEVLFTQIEQEADLSADFPEEVRAEAQALTIATMDGREDLRQIPTVTIDPPDAQDFDDALSCMRRDDGGFSLMVHIADVSAYVLPGSALDTEAQRRSATAYLAHRVIPMLPERLCNDLCSLRPHEDRPAVSVHIELDQHGQVQHTRVARSMIQSDARLTYDQVAAYLSSVAVQSNVQQAAIPQKLGELIDILNELRMLREKIRHERGSLVFDAAEAQVVRDATGVPSALELHGRNAATGLVEECMLLANEQVARMLAQAQRETLFRTHGAPRAELIDELIPLLLQMNVVSKDEVQELRRGKAGALQRVLEASRATPYAAVVSILLRRIQERALYGPLAQHYALAARFYCHFTSPIRRYADIVVHRCILELVECPQEPSYLGKRPAKRLAALAHRCNTQAITIERAERQSVEIVQAMLYKDRVDTVEEAQIRSIKDFGLIVSFDQTGASALIPFALMPVYYKVDELGFQAYPEAQTLRTHPTYTLGDRVLVRILGTDVARGQITGTLVSTDTAN